MPEKPNLMEAIDALITERTFSMEAVQAIANLKDKAANLEAELKYNAEKIKEKQEQIDSLKTEVSSLKDQISEQSKTIRSQQEEIEKSKPSKYEAEKQAAVANAYREALLTVFKPNTVREKVITATPVATQMPGGSSFVGVYSNEVITESEG